jgi:hypothetical protein
MKVRSNAIRRIFNFFIVTTSLNGDVIIINTFDRLLNENAPTIYALYG